MTTTITRKYPHPFQEDVAIFHRTFGHPDGIDQPGPLPMNRGSLRLALIAEEGVIELREALELPPEASTVPIIDAMIDALYVTLGTLVEMGQPVRDLPSAVLIQREHGDLRVNARTATRTIERLLEQLPQHLLDEDIERSVDVLSLIARTIFEQLSASGIHPAPFFNEVQASNMSKLGEDGLPIRSRGPEVDGAPLDKVLKGPNYFEPDLERVLHEERARLDAEPRASLEFERGVKAAVDAMRLFFLDENEQPIYNISLTELDAHTEAATMEALVDERARLHQLAAREENEPAHAL